jgi:uncharacterized protein
VQILSTLALTSLLLPSSAPQEPAQTDDPHAGKVANHLIHETSPYLLQHAYNPVEWYPWGNEAIERAKKEGKVIFLSIGYSACHWCHVMERESFENEEIAAYLKEHFISIKVDREERPDLDDLYMSAVQRMTGSGGWPMTVFLTPDLEPFYGGTYFPPKAKFGRPGFQELLQGIDNAWQNSHQAVLDSAHQMSGMLKMEFPEAAKGALPDSKVLAANYLRWMKPFAESYDAQWGGFGPAPKFPRTDDVRWLLLAAQMLPEGEASTQAREMALHTLEKMAAGGMYDQIGGGFARYSVDQFWRVPHFEKMLYDQGTLIPSYLEAWRQTGDEQYAAIVRQSCDYLLRERIDLAGGIWSATDADSEGEEGKFFAWDPAQLEEALGKQRALFAMARYTVTPSGTFEHGSSVLQAGATPVEAARAARMELTGTLAEQKAAAEVIAEEVRAALYAARAKRIPPHNDDKILTGWNGLAIDALAQAGRMLGEPRYTKAAENAARFLLRELRQPATTSATNSASDGNPTQANDETALLWHRAWRGGKAQHKAVLEDHAYLCRAFLSLFQSTGDEYWLAEAEDLGQRMLDSFWDEHSGIFWDTDGSDPTVLHRLKSPWDGAIPSPNSIALESLLMLHAFTQDARWLRPAEKGLQAVLPQVERGPRSFTSAMRILALATSEPAVAVVIGTGEADSLTDWRQALYRPGAPRSLAVFSPEAVPNSAYEILQLRPAQKGQTTLYLCRGATCQAPNVDPGSL